jgi:hypothetical protein
MLDHTERLKLLSFPFLGRLFSFGWLVQLFGALKIFFSFLVKGLAGINPA